jgi:hypothetical protein
MDTLGSSMSGLSMQRQQTEIRDGPMSRSLPSVIDLTVESDSDSDSGQDGQPPASSHPPLSMPVSAQGIENDTLDVTKLNYNFTMISANSIEKPIKKQYISVKSFLGRLDKNNRAYAFTASQYCRAWEHAVKLNENDVAINQLVATNPNLDPAGIETLFAKQMQEVIHSVSTRGDLEPKTR